MIKRMGSNIIEPTGSLMSVRLQAHLERAKAELNEYKSLKELVREQ